MSALNSSVVSAATTDGDRLFQWGIVLGGKRILQGITISLMPAGLWVVWWPGRSCTLRRDQVLVFINRHSPTMNLVEEKQTGLIPPGLQSWPLQLIEHFSNTTSVAPPPADPAGCRPLYLLHLLNFICQSACQSPRLSRSSCKMRQSCNEWMFLYRTQSSASRRTEDLILSGKSLMKIRKRISPKTDPWGTPDKTGTGSEAWLSKTTC